MSENHSAEAATYPRQEMSSDQFDFLFSEKKRLSEMYACVLVKGVLPSGERGYCYFGIFVDTLVATVNRLRPSDSFNPKDIHAIVLARATGEPTPSITEFMKSRFSFSDETTILEVSNTR